MKQIWHFCIGSVWTMNTIAMWHHASSIIVKCCDDRGRPGLSTLSRAYTEYSFFATPPPHLPREYFENVDFETPSQNRNAQSGTINDISYAVYGRKNNDNSGQPLSGLALKTHTHVVSMRECHTNLWSNTKHLRHLSSCSPVTGVMAVNVITSS